MTNAAPKNVIVPDLFRDTLCHLVEFISGRDFRKIMWLFLINGALVFSFFSGIPSLIN